MRPFPQSVADSSTSPMEFLSPPGINKLLIIRVKSPTNGIVNHYYGDFK